MMTGTFFNRKWWWTTLLVIAAMVVMVRLGFWQLDRRAQRQARNAEITRQLAAPPLVLTGDDVSDGPDALKYRAAIVRGEYDHTHEVILKNQSWNGQPGVHLITPLLIDGSDRAVLLDRGWIPYQEAAPENWGKFTESGPVEVTGMMRLSQARPGTVSAAQVTLPQMGERQAAWFRVDIPAIQAQTPYELLSIYVQRSPPPEGDSRLPYASQPQFDLSDGPHLGYAIQWFSFTLMLGIGYIHYVRKSPTES